MEETIFKTLLLIQFSSLSEKNFMTALARTSKFWLLSFSATGGFTHENFMSEFLQISKRYSLYSFHPLSETLCEIYGGDKRILAIT